MNKKFEKIVLVTGSDAILIVDAAGFIREKQSHSNGPCEIRHSSADRGETCPCKYLGDRNLNNAYSDIRRFNLNDRTRDFTAGEIDILYIGYERWDGTYERPAPWDDSIAEGQEVTA